MIQKIIHKLFRWVFVEVRPEDVITFKGGKIYLGKNEATDQETQNLIAEAVFFKESRLYQVLISSLGDKAKQKMFEKSETWEDMLGGKLMLYNLDVQKQIVELLASLAHK